MLIQENFISNNNKINKDTKKSYMVVKGIIDEEVVCVPPAIKGLKADCGRELFNDIFQITSLEELIDYEDLDDFVDVIYLMTEDYAEDTLNDVIMEFANKETGDFFAGIHAFLDVDEETGKWEVLYHLFSLENFEDELSECNDCLPYFEFLDDED